jgi:hypothetical protein
MMRKLALSLLALCAFGAQAQTTLRVQNSYNQAFGLTATVQLTGVGAGDTLVVCLRERDQSADPTVSDDVNGAWSTAVVSRNTTTARVSLFAFHNSGAGNPTITLTYGANKVFQGIAAAFNSTGAMSTGSTNNNGMTSTSHNAGNVTAGLGVMVACSGHSADSGGETIGDGFTAFTMTAGEREYHRYKITTGETVDADYTTVNSVSADHVLAGFTDAGGGGGGTAVSVISSVNFSE